MRRHLPLCVMTGCGSTGRNRPRCLWAARPVMRDDSDGAPRMADGGGSHGTQTGCKGRSVLALAHDEHRGGPGGPDHGLGGAVETGVADARAQIVRWQRRQTGSRAQQPPSRSFPLPHGTTSGALLPPFSATAACAALGAGTWKWTSQRGRICDLTTAASTGPPSDRRDRPAVASQDGLGFLAGTVTVPATGLAPPHRNAPVVYRRGHHGSPPPPRHDDRADTSLRCAVEAPGPAGGGALGPG